MADQIGPSKRGFRVATGALPAIVEQRAGEWFWIEFHLPLTGDTWIWVYDRQLCSALWQSRVVADAFADAIKRLTGLRQHEEFTHPVEIMPAAVAANNVSRLPLKPTVLAVPVISGPLPPDPYVLVSPDEHGWAVWLCPRYSNSAGFTIDASHWRRVSCQERKEDAFTIARHVATQLGGLDIIDEPLGGEAA